MWPTAPWDQIPYFFTPTQTDFLVTGVGNLIAESNPNRVALIIAAPAALGITVGINQTLSATQGINMSTTVPPLVILQRDMGPLCQMAWYASAISPNTPLTVIEVVLARWPGQ